MPVKIDPFIVDELQSMDLVIWEAKHPKKPVWNEKTGKYTDREDKSWVTVRLAGPGSGDHAVGGAPDLRQAVDAALRSFFPDRVPGLKGSVLRLEQAMLSLQTSYFGRRLDFGSSNGDDFDDDIPF